MLSPPRSLKFGASVRSGSIAGCSAAKTGRGRKCVFATACDSLKPSYNLLNVELTRGLLPPLDMKTRIAVCFAIAAIASTSWSDPTMTLVPGEGAMFHNPTGTPLTRTMVGEVQQGYSVLGIPNLYSLRSSVIPQSGRLVTDFGFPVLDGDIVARTINGVATTYTYNNGAWSPSEPSVGIGESFGNRKSLGLFWSRNFSVWP